MLSLFKGRFSGKKTPSDNQDTAAVDKKAEEMDRQIDELEKRVQDNAHDHDAQKLLMIKYNQALNIFASSKDYRHRVDNLFVKMDELRNTIRKNI